VRITNLIIHPRHEHFCRETQSWFIQKMAIVGTVTIVARTYFCAATFLSSPAQVAKLIFHNQGVA
jgi:hypothetical protein